MKQSITLLLILLFATAFANAQCAMCKAVVENGDKDMAEGINSGITFLMLFPYFFLALGIFIYYRNKKRDAKKM